MPKQRQLKKELEPCDTIETQDPPIIYQWFHTLVFVNLKEIPFVSILYCHKNIFVIAKIFI